MTARYVRGHFGTALAAEPTAAAGGAAGTESAGPATIPSTANATVTGALDHWRRRLCGSTRRLRHRPRGVVIVHLVGVVDVMASTLLARLTRAQAP
jgi:hypothetical protein